MAKIDVQKRREIMRRSMKIGACICDPRRKCPCEVFTQHGLCPCAGERPDQSDCGDDIKLMQLVHNAGCASKIPAGDLQDLLAGLPLSDDPAIIAGAAAGDDAGIYALNDQTTLVQTVDVFTPCVDDPHTFGKICAANCLSDIYAMGAKPRTALSVLCFPIETTPGRVMRDMMLGALEVLNDAGVALIGGHSVKDEEIKLGFAITGEIEKSQALRRDAMNEGDMLVLTKPLGIGVLNFAAQIGQASQEDIEAAENWMVTLNAQAGDAAVACGATGCTDITGFGLFGHLIGMLRSAGRQAEVFADSLPAMAGARDSLAAEIIPGAIERNREYVADDITITDGVEDISVLLGFDGQTSGGLLIAIDPKNVDDLLAALDFAVVVGRVGGESQGHITVVPSNNSTQQTTCCSCEPAAQPKEAASCCCSSGAQETTSCCSSSDQDSREDHSSCCSDIFQTCSSAESDDETAGSAAESQKAFSKLMRSSSAAGKLDERTKELINFALIILQRCEPCVSVHLKKAKAMGISQCELDEAAWCATAMGGAPVKLFWDEVKRKNS